MSARERAARLVIYKAVLDRIKELDRADRDEGVDTDFAGNDRVSAIVDGVKIGTVTRSEGSRTFKVYDEQAFLAWMIENRPTSIITAVRPSDRTAILAAIKKGGEVPDGVREEEGDPYLTVKPDVNALQQIDWRPLLGIEAPSPEQEASA